jgi:hypothetical protein
VARSLAFETDKRVLWKVWLPKDSAGVVAVINVHVTSDDRSDAYTYQRELSDLYVGEGLK